MYRHNNDPRIAVGRVRDWLRTESGVNTIPGGQVINERYVRFRKELPVICTKLRLDLNDLSFVDFSFTIAWWIDRNP